ncbi:TPR repeat, putative [Trypanosoma equiperdum]|uniref:TPR repeat, putative n=1 Tax=Trypanosoma equiperdum TaxID=5694 RepID=A0A1G4HZR5_TRYEQ|nr:TPR repeat, putative [Trypanosoma equiperdum]
MVPSIPQLLLELPVVCVSENHLLNGRLTLSVKDATATAQSYYGAVEKYLQGREPHLDLEKDVVPAIDFALRLFNAENFSGELVPAEREQLSTVLDRYATVDTLHERYVQRLLMSDGEMPHPCVRLSRMLLAVLATACSSVKHAGQSQPQPLLPYTSVWRLRCHMRHQLIMQHRAHSIFLHLSSCVDAALALPDESLTAEHLLEVGHVQNYYHQRELAAEVFWRAARKSGLSVSEDTMVGVRTRWQQQRMVQMVVNASSQVPFAAPISESDATGGDVPLAVMSEKDGHDLLDRPREAAEAPVAELQALQPLDKAIILALCIDIRNTNPYHGLTQHRMQTYVERLLSDPVPAPFIIQCQTLLLRARLERGRNRVQERAFMQMTELVDQHSAGRDPNRATFHRTDSDYFYSVAYPSIWQLRSEYADFCFDESLVKTALDAYEQVQDWENIIKCCKILDKRRRAESLARDLLESDPCNPLLWVALGEATREAEHLTKAWELSDHRSAAPMRALARLALEREEYERVVECFDEAVRLNPVFGGDWFALGYAAMQLKRWERSGEAFTRVCQIQPNDAYAWNNLASVLLRTGKLRPAFNAMNQALRNNRRDWRMWQNYFAIGCELKEVTETTNALNVLLDIAQRNVHLERGSLNRFVENAIAYMEGRIPASCKDQQMTEEDQEQAVEQEAENRDEGGRMHRAAVTNTSATHMGVEDDSIATNGNHVNPSDEDAMCDIVPLCADIDLPDMCSPSTNAAAAEEAERVREGVISRYKFRLRETFKRIIDLFVTDPDIYACAAKLLRYMDGPLTAYEMRQKELRCCQQKDQWERDTARFARTCECLNDMSRDLLDAVDYCGDSVDNLKKNNIVTVLSDTVNNVIAALEASEEYMEETAEYKQLRGELLPRMRKALKETKTRIMAD